MSETGLFIIGDDLARAIKSTEEALEMTNQRAPIKCPISDN